MSLYKSNLFSHFFNKYFSLNLKFQQELCIIQQLRLYSSSYIYTSRINALLKVALNSVFWQDLCKIKQLYCIHLIHVVDAQIIALQTIFV